MVRARAVKRFATLLPLLFLAGPAVALGGDLAPQLSLPDLEGKSVQLSRLKGKVVVVNFWATWCLPCREEIPEFVKLHKEYRERGLEIIGVAMDKRKEERVRALARELGIEYPIVIGDLELTHQWLVRGIPTTFLIDREGNVAQVMPGGIDKATLEKGIQPLLGPSQAAR